MNKTKKNILWVFLFLFFFNFLFFYSGGNLINVQYRSDLNSMVARGKKDRKRKTQKESLNGGFGSWQFWSVSW